MPLTGGFAVIVGVGAGALSLRRPPSTSPHAKAQINLQTTTIATDLLNYIMLSIEPRPYYPQPSVMIIYIEQVLPRAK